MSSLTIKFIVITAVLLFSIPISSHDTAPVFDFTIDTSQDLSAVLGEISLQAIGPDSFVSKWNTAKDGPSNSTQIKLPLQSSGSYDFIVDWGDGKTDTIKAWDDAEVTHTYYNSPGDYTVVIDGTLMGFGFDFGGGDVYKIIEISQWGNMSLGTNGYYFTHAENLVLTATDAPDLTGITSLDQAFRSCASLGDTGSMNLWDMSGVTDMEQMFYLAYSFNQPIGNWNVSGITDMAAMFDHAYSFNQPIGNWNVSNVTNIAKMFYYASSFDQPLGDWNVSNVSNMDFLLSGTTLSYQNYDHLLNGWSSRSLQSAIDFNGGNSKYSSNGATSRQYIIDTFGWTITDGGMIEFVSPNLNSPEDYNYDFGRTGNHISWTVGDANPGTYNITLAGVLYGDGTWTNGTISIHINGLTVGVHIVILYIFDIHENMASDSVIVTVTEIDPPEISSPDNVNLELGTTGNLLEWTVGDVNPATYNITLDEILYTADTWKNGSISLDIDGFVVGAYVVTLYVYDIHGNMASDTVVVTVTEVETTSSVASEDTDTTNTPIYFTFMILGLIVLATRRRLKS